MSRTHSSRIWRPLLAVSLLAGCHGRVEMDGLDDFGRVWSAVWMAEVDDDDDQSVWLSNVTGLCRKMQKAAVETEEFYDEFEDEYDDLDSDDEEEVCEFYQSMYGRMAKIYKPLYPRNAHYISMEVYDGRRNGLSQRAEFDDGTWEVGDPDDNLVGRVTYYDSGSLFQVLADEMDCDDDDWYDDVYEDFEDSLDIWYFDKGAELDITSVRSEKKLKGEFGGDLLYYDGDEDGEVQGRFSASWCEVEEDSYLYLY